MRAVTPTISPRLAKFWSELDTLRDERVAVEMLRRLLTEIRPTIHDAEPWLAFSDEGYQRNLMHTGAMYETLALCWKNGQCSTIHDHAHSVCGFIVLAGTATETVYEKLPTGKVRVSLKRELTEGTIVVSKDDDIHKISNFMPAGRDLVTMHTYSPHLEGWGVYDGLVDEG